MHVFDKLLITNPKNQPMERLNLLRKFITVCVGFMLTLATVSAQNVTVTGVVTGSDDGLPIAGATVLQKGTVNGVVTDTNGKYSITVPQNSVLAFSFMGMEPQEFTVQDQRVINVVMAPLTTMMDEVVVTALD
jgi:hypothetical protein